MSRIPTITKNLLILNVLLFLLTQGLSVVSLLPTGPIDLNDIFGLHFFLASDFHLYQLITYMFMHGGWTHLFFNMFALWMFGCVVENVWGPKKFLFYYIVCGVGAALFQEVAQFGEFYYLCMSQVPNFHFSDLLTIAHNSYATINLWTTVGASGAIYAILLAFGMIFPEQRIFIIPIPFPIKAKWFVVIYAAIELFSALATASDGVAHIAHLGGMVFGFFLIKYWQKHPTAGYGSMRGGQFFEQMKTSWEKRKYNSGAATKDARKSGNVDWQYNAEKRVRQEEVDRILDKIKKSGYDSLTTEEKKALFDSSNRR